MIYEWYKNIAYLGTIFWAGLGLLTIGSIAISSIGWVINLVMGCLFLLIGYFLYLRTKNLYRFYRAVTPDMQNISYLQKFLRLDLIFVVGITFLSGLLLMAGIFRVFGEGFAIFAFIEMGAQVPSWSLSPIVACFWKRYACNPVYDLSLLNCHNNPCTRLPEWLTVAIQKV